MTAWRAISTSALPAAGANLAALEASAHAIAASALQCETCAYDVRTTWRELPEFYATGHTLFAVTAMEFFSSGSTEWLAGARLVEQALGDLVKDLRACEETRATLAGDVVEWGDAHLDGGQLWRLNPVAVRAGFALWNRRDALATAIESAHARCRMTLARVGADPYGDDPNNGVRNVHDKPVHSKYFDIPLFLDTRNGVRGDQVAQGRLGDCWLMATMAALADQNPQAIRDMIHDNGDNTYTVTLWVGGEPVDYVVDGDTLVGEDGGPTYAGYAHPPTVLWPLILEKAAAQALGGYGKLDGDVPGRAIALLTGKSPSVDYYSQSGVGGFFGNATDDDMSLETFAERINEDGYIAVAESEQSGEPSHWRGGDTYPAGDARVIYGHAYEVADVSIGDDGEGTVTLVNPHNSDTDSDGAKPDTDSDVIVLSWDDFTGAFMRVTYAPSS